MSVFDDVSVAQAFSLVESTLDSVLDEILDPACLKQANEQEDITTDSISSDPPAYYYGVSPSN